MNRFFSLITTMLKIGFIGFGGGNALVPVIERETVSEGLISEDEFEKDVIVANITPGALPVELASGIGRAVAGWKGMLAAGVAMAAPGAVLVYLVLAFFSVAREGAVRLVLFASIGITGLIIYLLIYYTLQTLRGSEPFSKEWLISAALVILVFCATNGKAVNELFGITETPIFAVSALNVLAVTFFAIFFSQGNFRPWNVTVIAVIILLYFLSVGNAGIISSLAFRRFLQVLMVVLSVWGLVRSVSRSGTLLKAFPVKNLLREASVWVLFVLLLCLPALILYKPAGMFAAKACASVLMSFGGGDAYIAVAKGLFVGSEMISSTSFYGHVVTASNAMPGSILCKMLTGIGFMMGKSISPAACFWMALAGFACGVGVSGLTFLVMYYAYDYFQQLDIFRAVKKYFRPVIGGLLITVSVSMLNNSMEIARDYALSLPLVLDLTAVVILVIVFMRTRRKSSLFACIVVSALLALAVCSIAYYIP